jgi:hypothetical protein
MDATTADKGPDTLRLQHGPAPPAADGSKNNTPHAPATAMHAPTQQPWAGPPYRHTPTWGHSPFAPQRPKPKPFRGRELAAVVAMVVAGDVAFFSSKGATVGGFGLAVLFAAVPIAIIVAARARRMSVRLVVVGALLATIAIRSVLEPTVLTTIAGFGLIGVLAYALRARRSFVPEMVATGLYAIGKLPSRIGAAFAGVRKITSKTKLGSISVLPILVPVVLCAAFVGVFALANPVVAHGVSALWDIVASFGLPSPLRVFAWLVLAVASISILRPALRLPKGSEEATAEGEATKTSLLVSRNALVGLNALFFAYNALDAAYLWSGRQPAGMTTQQYAHEGAFWLTIALAMLTAVVGVMFRGALAHDVRGKISRALAFAWMAQGLVLAIGTYRRIAIHIAHSGLSDLRIVAILGTTLVACGVALVAYKLKTRRTLTWLVRRQLDAFALTVTLYAIVPTHLVAANVNTSRITSGEYRPLLHMFRQSKQAESAASLVPLLHHDDRRVRQGVAALLLDERDALRTEVDSQHSWRERDIASQRTLAALDAAAPDMEAAIGGVSRSAAKKTLLEISRVANEDRSWEEILAVPEATDTDENVRY